MTGRILEPTAANIERAAAGLRDGGLVGMPTETVYGLAADAASTEAVAGVFTTKNRPNDNPLIVHVSEVEQLLPLVSEWSDTSQRIADRFWPGPLTLVLPCTDAIGPHVNAGHPSVAVRSPEHPIARALIESFGRPLVAPSANRSGHVSPTTAAHVVSEFPDADFPVLDGGASAHGIESTVLSLTGDVPVVLRPGAVTLDQLRKELDRVECPVIGEQVAAPGTSPRHYAPETPATLIGTDELDEVLAESTVPAVVLAFGSREVWGEHAVVELPEDAEGYAHALYDALRRADALGRRVILIERPPLKGGLWRAINDRLRRACFDRT